MKKILIILLLSTVCMSCKEEKKTNGKLNIVTTTTMITDLVKNIGGDHINLQGLMGSGVDPHLYKASEGDVAKLSNADIIFYNGLHLEGKLVEVFEKMKNKKTIAISDALDKSTLIGSEYFASNYDPHIWFDINYWKQATEFVVKTLSEAIPEQKTTFETNGNVYIEKLNALKNKLEQTISSLPNEQRILVTAHDAFNYFGKAFDFEVVGLQGLSTATEAGVKDVQKLSAFIIENKVKAIFVESSVPKRTIEALQAAVKSKGHEVTIGGTLYSDALGDAGTIEGTYIGMFEYNVNTIVNALK
ncbi:metal ABC transporter solute-binding protein, Zn/Mn family [Algibacter luteus]|uniref:Manganese/zinc/iron transport system substrate-binding protein n=1 Tax=Algibacter luteus TaxID=1178825 RepID=A0A1M6D2F5_9FLAO|nr:zinc ABC transporter substrate-binding protein [Algibacter luteus]SHI67369.1 manganese/zinc/iron transport system substrate-binding protein [Algibacter luteus]